MTAVIPDSCSDSRPSETLKRRRNDTLNCSHPDPRCGCTGQRRADSPACSSTLVFIRHFGGNQLSSFLCFINSLDFSACPTSLASLTLIKINPFNFVYFETERSRYQTHRLLSWASLLKFTLLQVYFKVSKPKLCSHCRQKSIKSDLFFISDFFYSCLDSSNNIESDFSDQSWITFIYGPKSDVYLMFPKVTSR